MTSGTRPTVRPTRAGPRPRGPAPRTGRLPGAARTCSRRRCSAIVSERPRGSVMTSSSTVPTGPARAVLIANRGEIAVRVARACRDAGIDRVAVYAEADRDALHVAAGRRGVRASAARRPAESYLSSTSSSTSRAARGADAVHPGYGFLAENAAFARAVLDAGLVWIGPPPAAIDALGDKVKARHIAEKVGAPLVPGTADPVAGADEVVAFAERARPARRDQGGVRRRRARAEGGPRARGDPRAVRVGGARGGRGVRARRVLRRALPRPARATSRPSAWPTSTATSWSCRPATARCSAATRSSSRRPRRRS